MILLRILGGGHFGTCLRLQLFGDLASLSPTYIIQRDSVLKLKVCGYSSVVKSPYSCTKKNNYGSQHWRGLFEDVILSCYLLSTVRYYLCDILSQQTSHGSSQSYLLLYSTNLFLVIRNRTLQSFLLRVQSILKTGTELIRNLANSQNLSQLLRY